MAEPIQRRAFELAYEDEPRRRIRGRAHLPEGGGERPWVLVLHGFKGFMDWGFFPEVARRLVARNLAVVRFNFSGSGVGEDLERFTEHDAFFHNTPSREVEDLDRVRAWLGRGAVPWVDPSRAALLGHSLGGAVALIHAARRSDYRAVVGWASVAHFRRFPPEVEELWRRQGFVEIPNQRTQEVHRLGIDWLEDVERNLRALDVLGACRRLATPALFVHGSEDEAVPLAEGEALSTAFAPGLARLEVIPGASHTFGAVHPFAGTPPALERALRSSVDFLDERLR